MKYTRAHLPQRPECELNSPFDYAVRAALEIGLENGDILTNEWLDHALDCVDPDHAVSPKETKALSVRRMRLRDELRTLLSEEGIVLRTVRGQGWLVTHSSTDAVDNAVDALRGGVHSALRKFSQVEWAISVAQYRGNVMLAARDRDRLNQAKACTGALRRTVSDAASRRKKIEQLIAAEKEEK